jgi:hypothetical protein
MRRRRDPCIPLVRPDSYFRLSGYTYPYDL